MPDITHEQRLQLAIKPFTMHKDNFLERAEAIRWLLAFNSMEFVTDILRKSWRNTALLADRNYRLPIKQRYNSILVEAPAIYELAKQTVLSVEVRDAMYQLLLDMVSLFNC
jgi:hypothetical protein